MKPRVASPRRADRVFPVLDERKFTDALHFIVDDERNTFGEMSRRS
jgi:hypothetical protein